MSAAQGYDGMHLLYLAMRQAGSTDGRKIKAAFETLKARHAGVITNYNRPFSPEDHDAITENMLIMGRVTQGRVDYAYAEDQQRGGTIIRMKQKTQ
jgi:branched-chain amino acid transport system substrate-binding protein